MKKLLSILATIGLTATTTATVVACGEPKNQVEKDKYQEKFKDTIEVKLGDFNGTKSVTLWGENSIGALYASFWAVNNKPAIKDGFDKINLVAEKVLDKGESIKRKEFDDGTNVKLNGEALKVEEGQDWHTLVLNKDDTVEFNVDILEYEKGSGGEKFETHNININVKIVDEYSKKTIELDFNEVSIKPSETTIVTIKNASDLENIVVESKNEKTATASFEDGKITIEGKTNGETIISVTADNAEDATINIKVSEEPEPIEKVKAHLEKETIENFGSNSVTKLIIETQGATPHIELGTGLVEFDKESNIITAKGITGSVSFVVIAEGFGDTHLILKIEKAVASNIILETNLGELENKQSETIINKVKELNKLDKGFNLEVDGEPIKDGQNYTATIKSTELEGTVNVLFTLINEDIDIDIDTTEPIFLKANEELKPSVHINNFDKLENIQVMSENNSIASVATDEVDKYGDFHITARSVGETWINISADNANAIIKLHIIVSSEDAKDLKDILGDGNLGGLNDGEDTTIVQAINEKYADLKDAKITITKNNHENEATIYTDKTLGVATVSYFIKENISDLGSKIDAKVNMTSENIELMILDALHENINGEITIEDYETSKIDPIVKAGDKVIVSAKETSQLIQGSFEFIVSKYDINIYTMTLPEEILNANTEEIAKEVTKFLVQETKIDKIAYLHDYVLVNSKIVDGKIVSIDVEAKNDSAYITNTMTVKSDLNKQELDPYAQDHKIWVYNSGFKWDKDNNVESVELNATEWSQLLWTGMFDARSNSEGLKYFKENKLEEILHFTGNVNDILTNALKEKNINEFNPWGKGVTLNSEIIKSLGIKLDIDVIQYQNKDNPQQVWLQNGEIQFEDLTIYLGGSNS